MAYPDAVLADAPIAYWRLGAGSNDTVDSSGNSRTLTKTGTPSEVTGLLLSSTDGARDFPTGANYYEIPDNDAFDFLGTASFSVEAWIKPDVVDTAFRRLLSHEDGANGWAIGVHSSGVWFGRAIPGFNLAQAFVPLVGTAYHIVGTYDGVQAEIFVNAVSRDTTADARSMAAGAGTIRIGEASSGGTNDFDGVLDEVAVYSTELPLARIEAHYKASFLPPTPPSIASPVRW